MSDFKFCMHCGTKLPNEAKFCMECGKPTTVQSEVIEQPKENIEEIMKKMIKNPNVSKDAKVNLKAILAPFGFSKGVKTNRADWLLEHNEINEEEYKMILQYIDENYTSATSVSSSPKSTDQIIAEAKANHSSVVRCPKCGSTSIVTTNKKLSVKRAVVGTMLLNPIGGAVGAVTSKKMYNVCQNCGHRWKL